MSLRKEFIFRTSVVLSLCLFSLPALAGHGRFDLVKRVNKERMAEIYEQLNLSQEQKKSLAANREKNHAQIKGLKAQARSLKGQLRETLGQSEIDERKIEQLKQQLNKIQSQITDLRLEGIMEVRNILTPEQYKHFHQETSQ